MRIRYSGICDIGLKRDVNQDSIVTYFKENDNIGLFVVADGMGGYSEGERASQAITSELLQWIEHFSTNVYGDNFSKMMEDLENKLEDINREIFFKYNQEQICGSTCILLFIYKKYYGIINIGDSRIYKKEGWKVRSLMKDDVWENSPEVQESMSEKEIINHHNYGKLLQSVGTKETLMLTSKTDELKQGDTFLLCSDGLYKMCSEKKLARILQFVSESKVEECVNKMLSACYKAGAGDNVSIIVVKCV